MTGQHRRRPHRDRADRAGRLGRSRTTRFDVTPARLVTGLITERGVLAADARGAGAGFPGARAAAE